MNEKPKVVLITGAAKRVGKVITRYLHQQGLRVLIHFHHSKQDAEQFCQELNQQRENSAHCISANLKNFDELSKLIETAAQVWGQLDVLVNNASTFFPTPLAEATESQWFELIDVNLKAPWFLSQAAIPYLKNNKGCIINISDIHAALPLKGYPIYSIAKAGLNMLTKSLAKELGPDIRVNAIAPGVLLWPSDGSVENDSLQKEIISRVALKKMGDPQYVAEAAWFLMNAEYITGDILNVDGGRLLNC
jgi:pteridine reductase